ncbi:MAG: endonuclease V [Prochlorothrix sp.]
MLAIDVHYCDPQAVAAGVLFGSWSQAVPSATYTLTIPAVAPYVPGQFYQRELPCILALLETIPGAIGCIVIDGYVTLGTEARPGLGWHLWQHLEQRVPIIGVAKSAFQETDPATAVYRGTSQRPLYVTAAGVELAVAQGWVQQMHGDYRLPTLLKAVDRLCRQA